MLLEPGGRGKNRAGRPKMQRRQPVGATLPTLQTILTGIRRSIFANCSVFLNLAHGGHVPAPAMRALEVSAASQLGTESSMPEVADAGEDHGHAQPVSGVDDILISYRSAGLDDGRGAGLGYGLQAVGEGEEGVGGGDTALER